MGRRTRHCVKWDAEDAAHIVWRAGTASALSSRVPQGSEGPVDTLRGRSCHDSIRLGGRFAAQTEGTYVLRILMVANPIGHGPSLHAFLLITSRFAVFACDIGRHLWGLV